MNSFIGIQQFLNLRGGISNKMGGVGGGREGRKGERFSVEVKSFLFSRKGFSVRL